MKLEEITNRIYAEGVEKGQQQAAEIISKAQAEAAAIRSNAEKDAEEIVTKARQKADELDKNTRSELKLYAEQSVSAVKTEITNVITDKLVKDAVRTATSDAKFMQKLIADMATAMCKNGEVVIGCNQENVAYPSGLCAERTALFAAGAQYPDEPVEMLAIAARGTDGELQYEPVGPCGSCRQVIIESETRAKHPIRILLFGRKCVYVIDGISKLMPLSFTEF